MPVERGGTLQLLLRGPEFSDKEFCMRVESFKAFISFSVLIASFFITALYIFENWHHAVSLCSQEILFFSKMIQYLDINCFFSLN